MAHISAVAFPVWSYIRDELTARGWTTIDIAYRMGGDTMTNLCCLDLLRDVAPHDTRLTLGADTAAGLANAFGTSAELWLNLDASFRAAVEAGREICND